MLMIAGLLVSLKTKTTLSVIDTKQGPKYTGSFLRQKNGQHSYQDPAQEGQ